LLPCFEMFAAASMASPAGTLTSRNHPIMFFFERDR
jgi:hypothetical protein